MAFVWTNKVDGVDEVRAEDINSIAAEIPNRMSTADYVGESATGQVALAREAEYAGEAAKLTDFDQNAVMDEIGNINTSLLGKASLSTTNVYGGQNEFNVDTFVWSTSGKKYNIQEEINKVYDKADILILQSDKAKSLTITDSTDAPIVDYKIYGESTQNGTPSPAAPIDVASVGDLVTDIGDPHHGEYKFTITNAETDYDVFLTEPLRKIGTYEDYIDYETQKVVRKVRKYVIPKTSVWSEWKVNGNRLMFYPSKLFGVGLTTIGCFTMGETIQELTSTTDRSNTNSLFAISSTQTCYWYPDYTLMGLSGTEDKTVADAAMQSWLTTFGEISFLYVLKTPTETSITLNNIGNTTYPTTTITSNGLLQIQYKADTTNAYNNLKSELAIMKQAIISSGGTI